jgi:hypothetical protein
VRLGVNSLDALAASTRCEGHAAAPSGLTRAAQGKFAEDIGAD